MRTLLIVTALATLGTAAVAQQRQNVPQAPQPAPGVQPAQPPLGPGLGGGLALWLSSNPQALNLTADQLRRIQAAHERVQTANAALRQQIQTAAANRDVSTLGLAERHALMVRVRGLRQQLQTNVDEATTAAIAVLNQEQQRTIEALHQLRAGAGRGMARPGRGMRGATPGAMRGGMMGRGMRGGMMQGPMGQGGMGGGMGGMMMGPVPTPAPVPPQRPPL